MSEGRWDNFAALCRLQRRSRELLMRLRFAFRNEWMVYDWVDGAVLFRGTFRQCDRTLDELPGGMYQIVTFRDYNEYLEPF